MKPSARMGVVLIALGFAFGCARAADAVPAVEGSAATLRTSNFELEVALRGTGHVTIDVSVFSDRLWPVGDTVLAIHGLTETGPTYGPLAAAVFDQLGLRPRIGRVIAISLPGHGESGFPEGLPSGVTFGQLTIEDNVAVVLQVIDRLRLLGLAPQIIAGHSMGGLAVQASQQTLLAQGSSLAAKGIELAVLLAPVPPHGRPWTQPPPSDLEPFIVQDPELGPYLALSAEAWLGGGFLTKAGTIAPNAPTPDEVESFGYNGFEPLTTLLQLVEGPITLPDGSMTTVPRPSVDAGVFAPANGTRLELISFSEDGLVPVADLANLYEYLTGDATAAGLHEVVAPDAVHSMFISNPEGMIDALR